MRQPESIHRSGEAGFWAELVDELLFLEEQTARWILTAADPTYVEIKRLQSCFELTDTIRQARETADHEQLSCVDCGYEYFACGTITVQPCHKCGGQFFNVKAVH